MKRVLIPMVTAIAILYAILVSYSSPIFHKAFPSAQAGTADLSTWNFTRDGPIPLGGEWECYDRQLLTPADFAGTGTQTPRLTGLIRLTAGRLNNPTLRLIRPKGIRTYRLVVKTDGVARNYGLRIGNVRMSSRVYVDGSLLGEMGSPAPDGRGYVQRGQSNVVYFRSSGTRTEILIQVANYEYPFYGTRYDLFFGLQNQISYAMIAAATSELTGGVLSFLLGFLYLCLFLMRKRDRGMLFAAFEFWSLAGMELTFGEKPLYLFWSSIPFEVFGKIQSIALVTLILFILAYAEAVRRDIFPSWFSRLTYAAGAVYCLLVLTTPNRVYVRLNGVCDIWLIGILLCLLIRLLRLRRRETVAILEAELRLNIWCVAALIASLANAFLYNFNWIPNMYIGSLAAMAFFLLSIGAIAFRIYKSNESMLQAEVALLQEQIKPHFIHNAINTIISFCYTDGARAAGLLTNFSKYLRLTFDSDRQSSFEPLGRELDRVRAYVQIEQARFGDCIRVRYDIDPELMEYEIPALIIQPLVENAIRHGLRPKPKGGLVTVAVHDVEGGMLIRVSDTGVGMPPELAERLRNRESIGHGVGLYSVIRRVDQWKGARLDIRSIPGRGTDITITVGPPGRTKLIG